jgi:hypothetical protein
MQQRQNVNINQLLEIIEHDMSKNKQMISSVEMQINEVDGTYQSIKTSNKVMQSNMQKLEYTLGEVQRDEADV